MKIAIFTDTYLPEVNGVARTLKRFTDYLTEAGIEFIVFAPQHNKEDFFSNRVYSVKSFSFFLYPECRVALPNMREIREEVKAFNPDLIHVMTPFNMGLSGVHIAKKLNIPLVGSYHTDFDKYLQYYDLQFLSDVIWKYMEWFHRPLKKIFVPSQETLDQLAEQGFDRLAIWSRGIDRKLFHPDYDEVEVRSHYNIKEKYILTYVGRIAKEKDVLLLPEIAKNLANRIKNDVHWLIVGDGPLREEMEQKAFNNMTFTGFVEGERLANIYDASHLFVFPSPTETFGNVVLEAMSCGTPVICANAGGVKSIVKNGMNGMLCDEKDVTDFVQTIDSLLLREHTRYVMSENGIRYAQAQSWERIFQNLLSEYEDVLLHAPVQASV